MEISYAQAFLIKISISKQQKGAPQGGPLSPILANVYLNKLDRELEKRGHRFIRYADDFVIYVKSKRAGERVMESVTTFHRKRFTTYY